MDDKMKQPIRKNRNIDQQSIEMEFGIEKCKMLVMQNLVISSGINMSDGKSIRMDIKYITH